MTHLRTALAGLAPVTLTELVDRAALLTRIDRKYVLAQADAVRFLNQLDGARVLDIGDQRAFGYSSDYYDTHDLASFHLAAHKRRRRFKVRRRTYLESGDTFVEVKTRSGRGATVKERIPVDDASSPTLSASERTFVDARLSDAQLSVRADELAPALRSTYERSTLLLPSNSRLTLDAGLTWQHADHQSTVHQVRVRDRVIVETKAGSAASEADRLLWSLGHRPARISKYGTGLAVLRSDLPRNKWHRVIQRDLDLEFAQETHS